MLNFKKLENNIKMYQQIYEWVQNDFVYEWFEQRKLNYNEVVDKYKSKIGKQDVNIIIYNEKDIGFFQIYKYKDCEDIYEFDVFIGEKEYLNKGYGQKIVKMICNYIFNKYKASSIILRPFKLNKRAINCYLKCGFKIIDEYVGEDTLNNYEEIVVMELNYENNRI